MGELVVFPGGRAGTDALRAEPRLAHDDARVLDAARVALTTFLCRSEARRGTHPVELAKVLDRYARTAVTDGGVHHPAPLPALPAGLRGHTLDVGRKAMRLTGPELVQKGKELRQRPLDEQALADPDLQKFFDLQLLAPAGCMIVDRYELARLRVAEILESLSLETVPGDRSKADGPPARSSLHARAEAARLFMAAICQVSRRFGPESVLAGWRDVIVTSYKLPRRAPRDKRVLPAVPLHIARRGLQHVEAPIARALGTAPLDFAAQREAISCLSDSKVRHGALLMPLVERSVLCACATLGLRGGTGPTLDLADLLWGVDVPPGIASPCIGFTPGKSDGQHMHYVGVPAALAECLLALHDFAERYSLVARGEALPREGRALLLNQRLSRFGLNSIYPLLAGARPATKHRGRVALLRHDPPDAEAERLGLASPLGTAPHGLRKMLYRSLGSPQAKQWFQDHGHDPSKAKLIASCVAAHHSNEISDLYDGFVRAEDVRAHAAVGAQVSWLMLTTDLGARRAYDIERMTFARRIADVAQTELERLDDAEEALSDSKAALIAAAHSAEIAGDSHALAARRRELEVIDLERDQVERQRRKALRAQRTAQDKFVHLTTPAGMAVVSDAVPAFRHRVPCPEQIQEAKDAARDAVYVPPPIAEAMREGLTIAEVARFFDTNPSTVNREIAGKRNVRGEDRFLLVGTSWFLPGSTQRRRVVDRRALNPRHPRMRDREALAILEQILATPLPTGWGIARASVLAGRR
jgi:hypothetical protein